MVLELNYKRTPGMLYCLNKDGDLMEIKPKTGNRKIVASTGITKESGYLYFLDKQGNISKVKMRNNR